MSSLAKATLRASKNLVNGRTGAEAFVRVATSSDDHGPSQHQLVEIAELTHEPDYCAEVIQVLDKRLSDRGKMWRHAYKSLIIIEHLYVNGGAHRTFLRYYVQNVYLIKTLQEYQYVDSAGIDRGAAVRERARVVTRLLQHPSKAGDLLSDLSSSASSSGGRARASSSADVIARRDKKQELDKRPRAQSAPDTELATAMRLSREEDERRRRELAAQSGASLFDDFDSTKPAVEPSLVDLSDSGTVQTAYDVQQAQLQAQQLQMQQMQQLQMAQQLEAQAQQAAYDMQQQQQHQMALMQQQQYQQQIYSQQQAAYELYQHQQLAQAQYLAQAQAQAVNVSPAATPMQYPQATGVNNPFAAFASTPTTPSAEQQRLTHVTQISSPSPSPGPNSSHGHRTMQSGRHAELERMLAGGSGSDTFGNYGNLRVPVGSQFASRTGYST